MTTDYRTDFIAGLRSLANLLETQTDLPVPRNGMSVMYFPVRADDAEMYAEIDRIAAILGTPIDLADAEHGHYSTGLHFGPIEYKALAISAEYRARHLARISYEDNVITDTTHAA